MTHITRQIIFVQVYFGTYLILLLWFYSLILSLSLSL